MYTHKHKVYFRNPLFIPHHEQRFLAVEHTVDVVDDLTDVIVGDLAGPACANPFGPIHQHSGDNGNVPFRLHTLIIVVVVFEQVVVHRWENKAGQRTEDARN